MINNNILSTTKGHNRTNFNCALRPKWHYLWRSNLRKKLLRCTTSLHQDSYNTYVITQTKAVVELSFTFSLSESDIKSTFVVNPTSLRLPVTATPDHRVLAGKYVLHTGILSDANRNGMLASAVASFSLVRTSPAMSLVQSLVQFERCCETARHWWSKYLQSAASFRKTIISWLIYSIVIHENHLISKKWHYTHCAQQNMQSAGTERVETKRPEPSKFPPQR